MPCNQRVPINLASPRKCLDDRPCTRAESPHPGVMAETRVRPRRVAFVGLLACALSWTVPLVAAAGQAGLDEGAVRRFLGELQRSVARDDRGAVSRLMHYPLTVWAAGVRIPIPDSAALLRNYDAVFSPALKDVIARAELPRDGRPAPAVTVTISPSGAFLQGDAITIERVGDRLGVARVSVPLAPAGRGHAGAPSRSDREPKRLIMGLRTVQRAGVLTEGARDSYVIWADKNQLLEVRITGVRQRDIVARILQVKTQAPVDARAREGGRTWIGRIPENGEYRIDVVRLAGGREPLPYLLSMRLR